MSPSVRLKLNALVRRGQSHLLNRRRPDEGHATPQFLADGFSTGAILSSASPRFRGTRGKLSRWEPAGSVNVNSNLEQSSSKSRNCAEPGISPNQLPTHQLYDERVVALHLMRHVLKSFAISAKQSNDKTNTILIEQRIAVDNAYQSDFLVALNHLSMPSDRHLTHALRCLERSCSIKKILSALIFLAHRPDAASKLRKKLPMIETAVDRIIARDALPDSQKLHAISRVIMILRGAGISPTAHLLHSGVTIAAGNLQHIDAVVRYLSMYKEQSSNPNNLTLRLVLSQLSSRLQRNKQIEEFHSPRWVLCFDEVLRQVYEMSSKDWMGPEGDAVLIYYIDLQARLGRSNKIWDAWIDFEKRGRLFVSPLKQSHPDQSSMTPPSLSNENHPKFVSNRVIVSTFIESFLRCQGESQAWKIVTYLFDQLDGNSKHGLLATVRPTDISLELWTRLFRKPQQMSITKWTGPMRDLLLDVYDAHLRQIEDRMEIKWIVDGTAEDGGRHVFVEKDPNLLEASHVEVEDEVHAVLEKPWSWWVWECGLMDEEPPDAPQKELTRPRRQSGVDLKRIRFT